MDLESGRRLRAPPESCRRALSEDRQHHHRQRVLVRPGIPVSPPVRRAHGVQQVRRRVVLEVLDDRRAPAGAAARGRPCLGWACTGSATIFRRRTSSVSVLTRRATTKSSTASGIRCVGGSGTYRPIPWLNLTAGVNYLNPSIDAFSEEESLLRVFGPAEAPGALVQPDFYRYSAAIDVNRRVPTGNPRRGGQYVLWYNRYDDADLDLFSFNRSTARDDRRHCTNPLRGRR